MKKPRTSRTISQTDRAVEFPELEDEVSLSSLRARTGLLSRMWRWMQARQTARSSTRRLRVAETVSLGEKRFVAVVQVDGRHFLLAGGPTNIALLAQLDANVDFEDVLKKTMTVPAKRPAKRKQPANTAFQRVPGHLAGLSQKKSNKQATTQPANLPLGLQKNRTKAFSAVVKETIAAPKRPRKHKTRHEVKPDISQDIDHNTDWAVTHHEEYA